MRKIIKTVEVKGPAVTDIRSVDIAVIILDAISGTTTPSPENMREALFAELAARRPDLANRFMRAANDIALYVKDQIENARPLQ